MKGAAPLRVLQITDTHLKARAAETVLGVDTAATLGAVLAQALAEHTPDAVLASGDLAHDPQPATYQRFSELLEAVFAGPVLHLPGNHDLTEAMNALWSQAPEAGSRALRLGDWEIIGVDSHADGRAEAALSDAARADLQRRIRNSTAAYLLVACHHPPLPVGSPWLDKDCIPQGEELLESCAAQARVRGLVFGHVHQQVEVRHGRLAVLGTPSTCFQFEPGSRAFAIDRSADTGRPGYRWLELGADGTLVTRMRRLDGYTLNIDMSDRS